MAVHKDGGRSGTPNVTKEEVTKALQDLPILLSYTTGELTAMIGRNRWWVKDLRERHVGAGGDEGDIRPTIRRGGPPRWTPEAARDLMVIAYNYGWLSMDELRSGIARIISDCKRVGVELG